MPGITVTRGDLEEISGATFTEQKFIAVSAAVRGMISAHYRGEIDGAVGRNADVLNAVFTSAALRVSTNPQGARSIGLGSANVTFGGGQEDIANVGSLSLSELAALGGLRGRVPTSVSLIPYDDATGPLVTGFSRLTGIGNLTDSADIAAQFQ